MNVLAIIVLIIVTYFALTVRVVPRRPRQTSRTLYLEDRRRADRRADLEDLVREACGG